MQSTQLAYIPGDGKWDELRHFYSCWVGWRRTCFSHKISRNSLKLSLLFLSNVHPHKWRPYSRCSLLENERVVINCPSRRYPLIGLTCMLSSSGHCWSLATTATRFRWCRQSLSILKRSPPGSYGQAFAKLISTSNYSRCLRSSECQSNRESA